MAILRLSSERPLLRLAISFCEDGEVSVATNTHKSQEGSLIFLELFGHFLLFIRVERTIALSENTTSCEN